MVSTRDVVCRTRTPREMYFSLDESVAIGEGDIFSFPDEDGERDSAGLDCTRHKKASVSVHVPADIMYHIIRRRQGNPQKTNNNVSGGEHSEVRKE